MSHAILLTLPEIREGSLSRPPWRYVREGEDRNSVLGDGWGSIAGGGTDDPKYAHVLQCVVHSEVAATDDKSFQTAATQFGDELSDWWALVCDWLDVLTLQDFAGLGRAQRSILDNSVVERRPKRSPASWSQLSSHGRRNELGGSS